MPVLINTTYNYTSFCGLLVFLLVSAGVWNLLALEVPFLPYLFFAVALGVLVGAFLQRR